MSYIKAENMAEQTQISNLPDANRIPDTYSWTDQAEKTYPQNMPPQMHPSQMTNHIPNMRRNNMKSKDNDDKKIFIGGLHYNTTEQTLRDYFTKFGELQDAVVIRHVETKRSRGFGFVSFTSQEEVDACQNARPHVLDEKTVETKRAVPRGIQAPARGQNRGPGSAAADNKVFVGGIKEEVNDEDLKQYFSTFGNVKQVKIIIDKNTLRKRGFAFVEFDDYDPVHKCILQRNHEIGGNRVDVKSAVNRKEANYGQRNMNPPRPGSNPSANYSWMNGGGGYGQPGAPAGYTWDYYNSAYGVGNAAAAQSQMGYGQAVPEGYGYAPQVYSGVPPPNPTADSMMAQMYPGGYGGAPAHGYGTGMSAANGGGPIRTPPHKGYRQAHPYQTSDNDHKKQ